MKSSWERFVTGDYQIKNRWTVVRCIGRGSFGWIFSAFESSPTHAPRGTPREVALKLTIIHTVRHHRDEIEKSQRKEVAILKRLSGSPYIPEVYDHGNSQDGPFIAMTLLGQNLSDLRRSLDRKRMKSADIVGIAPQLIRALEYVHSADFVHRDVKPSNFCIGRKTGRKVYLIDFSIARVWKPDQLRQRLSFRGTPRYASVSAHLGDDVSPRDDLWSLLFTLIELLRGSLPWKRISDVNEIRDAKILAIQRETLITGLPLYFRRFFAVLKRMEHVETPNYQALIALFQGPSHLVGQKFEWEDKITPDGDVRRRSDGAKIESDEDTENEYRSPFNSKVFGCMDRGRAHPRIVRFVEQILREPQNDVVQPQQRTVSVYACLDDRPELNELGLDLSDEEEGEETPEEDDEDEKENGSPNTARSRKKKRRNRCRIFDFCRLM